MKKIALLILTFICALMFFSCNQSQVNNDTMPVETEFETQTDDDTMPVETESETKTSDDTMPAETESETQTNDDTVPVETSLDEFCSDVLVSGPISEYLIYEKDELYLVLPMSQYEVLVREKYMDYLDDIDIELLKTAEKNIIEKTSSYTDDPPFFLGKNNEGYFCLSTEVIVAIDPSHNGFDHKHIFFYERLTN